jgi:prepilin-type processing-associated H-X9-DG protein
MSQPDKHITETEGVAGAYSYNNGGDLLQFSTRSGGEIHLDGGLGGDTNGVVRESAISSPSQLIAIGDSTMRFSYIGPPIIVGLSSAPQFEYLFADPPFDGHPPASLDPGERAMVRRHGNQWIMVFCDGHVEHGRPQKFFNYNSDDVLSLWNRDHQPHRR